MSSIPHFLNPANAAIAAAIAMPLLLLLYFLKLRRREQDVSSTLLWRKAIQDLQVNAPFQRLRRNLLLLLQLLLLALLCLALARPVSNYKPGAGKFTVILIDRSASMSVVEADYSNRTRLEEAKRRANELVDSMTRQDMATVIAFDDSAENVQTFTADAVRLRQAINSIKQTDRRTALKLAYLLASAQATFPEAQLRANQVPDVFLYSDGRVTDGNELSLKGNLHYDHVGTAKLNNIGVVALSAKRNYERPDEVEIFARLANFGSEPVEADVQLFVDDHERATAAGPDACYLYPESWNDDERQAELAKNKRPPKDSIEFPKIIITQAAVVRLEQMHKEGDALAADDSASVIVPQPKTLSVLFVSEGNFFLNRALESLDLKHPDSMRPEEYESKKPSAYDVILFDRYKPTYLPPAGNLVYIGVVPDNLKMHAVRTMEGAPPTDSNPPVLDKDLTILDWKRDHPILRGLQLGKVYIGESYKLRVPLEDEVLIEGTQGPLVVLERQEHLNYLVIAFDVQQSNWPLKPSFPHFMYSMLQYLAIGSDMDVRESYPPGSTPRIPRSQLLNVDPNLQEIRMTGPMGEKRLKIPETGDFVLPALDKVGVYTLDPPIPRFEKIAVNLLDLNESNLQPADAPGSIDGKGDAMEGGNKKRLELWWWIVACAALPLLMIEWWVYTRRVHL